MPAPRPHRGFSLIELVVATAASVIVLVMMLAATTAQQRAFYGGQKTRTAQENARAALLYLEQKLPLAGWGMDPSLALDFRFYSNAATCPTDPAMACPVTRDSTGDADELVFYARNGSYWVPAGTANGPYTGRVWSLVAISATDVDLAARANDVFAKGQILQAVCPGTLRYAYFTVGTTTTASATGTLTIPLEDVVEADPFKRQDVAAGLVGCRVFQIDRYRFHIRPVPQGGDRFVPYLVLDRGLDVTGNSDGTPDDVVDEKDEIFIAEGIEGFQVAYEFPNPALGRAGGAAGTPIAFSAANNDQTTSGTPGPNQIARTTFPGNAPASGDTIYAPSSFYRYSFSDPMRQTFHQANIRAVHIALVARSPEPDQSAHANIVINSAFTLLNQSGGPTWVTHAPEMPGGTDGYQRLRVEATLDLPNMTVRSITGF